MTDRELAPGAPVKRTDVGYKRPPAEHQFKKGQKPPPRKPKAVRAELYPTEILWMVLREQRRVLIDGKVAWMPNVDLIWRKAMELAEAGNATMQRTVTSLLFSLDEGKPKLNGRTRIEIDGVHAGWMPEWEESES
jgi:hypothetical protein